jgi:hypothetical protein
MKRTKRGSQLAIEAEADCLEEVRLPSVFSPMTIVAGSTIWTSTNFSDL